MTRSRDYLHSNSLCGKQNSVEQQLVNIGVRSRQHNDRRKTCRASKITNLKNLVSVNSQNCHHETKHWQETMKTLRVKQNRVQTTVRRRQYDDRRENCTACIHHRFSVTCTTAILILRFVSNYATGIQSVIWMKTTKYFHSIV